MGLEELILAEREKRGEKRGMERGIERGIERKNRETVTHMISKNLTDEMIADFANVPIDYVQKIRKLC
jgi:predicted transposase YdaD